MKVIIHKYYKKFIRPYLKERMSQQRVKLIFWDVWGYWEIIKFKNLSILKRIYIVYKCIVVDWNVPHGHKPSEIIPILKKISESKQASNEVFVEAGCWLGGSTIKFSLLCDEFNFPLHVFDSFEGVEYNFGSNKEEEHFFGQYVGPLEKVKAHIEKFGEIGVCTFHKGWFIDTFPEFDESVKVAYIDCDLIKGTLEVLESIVPNLTEDGIVYSQDYHISSIREVLNDAKTWEKLKLPKPTIKHISRNLASIKF